MATIELKLKPWTTPKTALRRHCQSGANPMTLSPEKIAEMLAFEGDMYLRSAMFGHEREILIELQSLRSQLSGMTEETSSALKDVAAERQRQMDAEGWTLEHDDEHNRGEIAYAAACYALATRLGFGAGWLRPIIERLWPWSESWWRPTKPRRNLVKAGALILAEIERLDRAEPTHDQP